MNYFLVLLSDVADVPPRESDSHERFIDSLIARNAVLLGGGFASSVGGSSAGYVLVAKDIDEAEALAREDPLVEHGIATYEITEWRLVGINTAAIDPDLALSP